MFTFKNLALLALLALSTGVMAAPTDADVGSTAAPADQATDNNRPGPGYGRNWDHGHDWDHRGRDWDHGRPYDGRRGYGW